MKVTILLVILFPFLLTSAAALSYEDALDRAAKGDYNAQSYLGHLFLCGKEVKQDYRRARFWYGQILQHKKADSRIKAHANLMLGLLYKSGKGGVQCYTKAMECFRIAARQGYTDAHIFIGLFYAKGLGVEKDLQKALYWWKSAAEKGHPGAARYIAALKGNGDLERTATLAAFPELILQ